MHHVGWWTARVPPNLPRLIPTPPIPVRCAVFFESCNPLLHVRRWEGGAWGPRLAAQQRTVAMRCAALTQAWLAAAARCPLLTISHPSAPRPGAGLHAHRGQGALAGLPHAQQAVCGPVLPVQVRPLASLLHVCCLFGTPRLDGRITAQLPAERAAGRLLASCVPAPPTATPAALAWDVLPPQGGHQQRLLPLAARHHAAPGAGALVGMGRCATASAAAAGRVCGGGTVGSLRLSAAVAGRGGARPSRMLVQMQEAPPILPSPPAPRTPCPSSGVAVFGLLNTLNAVWLFKLVKMVARDERRARGSVAGAAAGKHAAAVAAGKAAAGGAAVYISASSATQRSAAKTAD